ncbi:unnamed protein product [marine sediment metagenome]|uniref:VTT domain-containing protein n=1 Tax=marine sediment metagenome TaxID=412755 RepID=X1S2H3_9ZZZZ
MKRGFRNFINQLKKHWLFVLILIILFTWVIYSYFSEGIFYLLATSDIDSIVAFINSFGWLAVVAFILIVVLEVVIAPIPPLVLYVVGGIIFGTFLGGTITLFGNVLGAVIAFLIARKFGRNLVERKISKRLRGSFDKFTKKYGGWALFLIRLNPFTTSDLFSYLAGLTKMRLRTLIISTTFGLIPLVYIQTYLGDVFIRDNPFLFFLFIIVSIIYLALFLYGLWYLILRKKKTKKR